MAVRQSPQPLPSDDVSLEGFPVARLQQGRTVLRSHRKTLSPGWRASVTDVTDADGGRFDLASPNGTLYVADDVETAVRERIREKFDGPQTVSATLAGEFEVSVIAVDGTVDCADVSSGNAARYGVTRQIETTEDYTVTHAWAEAFHQTGYRGVRYGSRFTSGPARAWALFGKAGPCDMTVVRRIAGPVACRMIGVQVLPPIDRIEDVTLI